MNNDDGGTDAPREIHGLEVVTIENENGPDCLDARIKIGDRILGCAIGLPPDWRTNPRSFQLSLAGLQAGLMSVVEKELRP